MHKYSFIYFNRPAEHIIIVVVQSIGTSGLLFEETFFS